VAQQRTNDAVIVDLEGLDALIASLRARGYVTRGPVVRDGAIVAGNLGAASDLPIGYADEQGPGHYRLLEDGRREAFAWAVGPQSLKGEFFPSRSTLLRASSENGEVTLLEPTSADSAPTAFIGARPCELAGLSVLDRVMSGGAHPDAGYVARRHDAFIAVAECGAPSANCFCTSMGTGPGVEGDYDLAITELSTPSSGPTISNGSTAPRYLLRAGSDAGRSLLGELPQRRVEDSDWQARETLLAAAAQKMGERLDTDGLPELLARNLDHPRWTEVAERCLACGNCTAVCPTCFCSDVHDISDLTGAVERTRRWSSCFELAHSFMHGGAVRTSTSSRYRQWATHKLSTWHDQFGTSGCVGCGRCITWCPVGIDITEEARAIKASDGTKSSAGTKETTT
jgi:ferredoxin